MVRVGLQVSKDVDSGITHYVCIHVASEVTTKAARELDPTSPVALPKLPNGMAETPTARSAAQLYSSCCHCFQDRLPWLQALGPDCVGRWALDLKSTGLYSKQEQAVEFFADVGEQHVGISIH